ncbi:MAG: stage II sporulation protein M [Candidatus Pacearchaeota archaeon]
MLEMIISPKRSKKKPWELFFVGLIFASVSILMVHWIFSGDIVLSKYSGILVVTFTVMFSIPYIYYSIRLEESEDLIIEDTMSRLKEHGKALHAFIWLFIGFIVAFSFWYIILGSTDNYKAQIETYCSINSPGNFEGCTSQYGASKVKTMGASIDQSHLFKIFSNNLYVLIFAVIFSLIFGAGGIFILAWNASVISAAMVIFAKSNLYTLPISLVRYMIHGIPEIGAYFAGTLAGGIIGISIVKKEFKSEKFWDILHDSLSLIIFGLILLIIAAFIEVYITPKLF